LGNVGAKKWFSGNGLQAASCPKTGLRAKYKLPAAHHLLSSFACGSAKSRVSGLNNKYSASFEETVNRIYSIINFQINIYSFLNS